MTCDERPPKSARGLKQRTGFGGRGVQSMQNAVQAGVVPQNCGIFSKLGVVSENWGVCPKLGVVIENWGTCSKLRWSLRTGAVIKN